jgi:hypothetical protein
VIPWQNQADFIFDPLQSCITAAGILNFFSNNDRKRRFRFVAELF